jgi:putative flippase GtrA
MTTAPTQLRPARQGLRFVVLSGIGWSIDTTVFTLLVATTPLTVLLANIVGGACGASFAFLTSRRWVFSGVGSKTTLRLTLYLVYTVLLILTASVLVDLVHAGLTALAESAGSSAPRAAIALVAKCLVTPLLLASNFFVARHLARREL